MQRIKPGTKDAVKVPYSLRPKKKYSLPTAIPPASWLFARWRRPDIGAGDVGRTFRVGYHRWMDSLDCIWLVSESGKYEQTINHEFLQGYFEIALIAKERNLYGKNRPRIPPMDEKLAKDA